MKSGLISLQQSKVKEDYEMKHKLKHINEIFEATERRGIILSENMLNEGLLTYFKGLDKAIGGLRPGSMTVIVARPGVGKTTFTLQMAKNIAKTSNKAVAYFSLAEDNEQLAMRLLSIVSNVDAKKIHSGNLNDDEQEKVKTAQMFLRRQNMFINHTTRNINDINEALQNFSNLGLVIIDYFQLISCEAITRAIKRMAVDLNVPIIVVSNLSRNSEKRKDKRPKLSDLEATLEQDGDVIMFLYRDAYYNENSDPTIAECIIAKNRYGETLTIPLVWNDECGWFKDIENGEK